MKLSNADFAEIFLRADDDCDMPRHFKDFWTDVWNKYDRDLKDLAVSNTAYARAKRDDYFKHREHAREHLDKAKVTYDQTEQSMAWLTSVKRIRELRLCQPGLSGDSSSRTG